ncbi:SulP family inorganic anion transporter, partial [Vibrio anguillarum]
LADFLSRPILLGLLNGVALTIIVGQFAKVFGLKYEQQYLLERIVEAPSLLIDLHWQTLLISALTVVVYFLCKRVRPNWPAAMLAIIAAAFWVWFFGAEHLGVKVVGL